MAETGGARGSGLVWRRVLRTNDLDAAYGKAAHWCQTVLPGSKHAGLVNLAAKSAILYRGVSHLIFPDEVQNLPAAEGASAIGHDGFALVDVRADPELI